MLGSYRGRGPTLIPAPGRAAARAALARSTAACDTEPAVHSHPIPSHLISTRPVPSRPVPSHLVSARLVSSHPPPRVRGRRAASLGRGRLASASTHASSSGSAGQPQANGGAGSRHVVDGGRSIRSCVLCQCVPYRDAPLAEEHTASAFSSSELG
eukprot:scaffold879_cov410-Prasinococcus_capsulatus_cf.AAC.28